MARSGHITAEGTLHGLSPRGQWILPTGRVPYPALMSSAVYLWKTFREQAEQHSGVGQKVFGFVPESVFGFSPEWCSASPRNAVRLAPEYALRECRRRGRLSRVRE